MYFALLFGLPFVCLLAVSKLGVVSYDPNLDVQCLSIKDSISKSNATLLAEVIANPSMIERDCKLDMASVFFGAIFGPAVAPRVMSGTYGIFRMF